MIIYKKTMKNWYFRAHNHILIEEASRRIMDTHGKENRSFFLSEEYGLFSDFFFDFVRQSEFTGDTFG